MNVDRQTIVIANTLVQRSDEKVLLLTRALDDHFRPGEYDFPGGKVEAQEDAQVGAARELSEEAGIAVDAAKFALIHAAAAFDPGQSINRVFLTFWTRAEMPEVELSHEHNDYAWRDVPQALQMLRVDEETDIQVARANHDIRIAPAHLVTKTIIRNSAGKLLIIRRSASAPRRALEWDLAGGYVEPGEQFTVAAAREVKEEAGLDLDPSSLRLSYAFSADDGDDHTVCWLFYIGDVAADSDQTVSLSYEHDSYRWVSPEAALNAINYDVHHEALAYLAEHALI